MLGSLRTVFFVMWNATNSIKLSLDIKYIFSLELISQGKYKMTPQQQRVCKMALKSQNHRLMLDYKIKPSKSRVSNLSYKILITQCMPWLALQLFNTFVSYQNLLPFCWIYLTKEIGNSCFLFTFTCVKSLRVVVSNSLSFALKSVGMKFKSMWVL